MSEHDATLGDEFGSGETLTASDAPGSRGGGSAPERGTLIGRYLVLGKLGAGAMGVVLAAHDPELDRKIALKLLVAHAAAPERARARLQREAQALAKLDHPNVVGVHDVGVHGDQLFVAMEFVAGQTLGAWMKGGDPVRPWPEVVSKFVEAGRGLAAAHDAGLIHRDFKPENVMLGDDGRVRVLDFGLARAASSEDDERSAGVDESTIRAPRDTLTRSGALVGTPAYMAPEQFHGQPADALADQFSFCVSLYEALHGQRPFVASGIAELLDAMQHERIAAAPRASSVPTWLRKAVVRGLARDPTKRWPSMAALLDQLVDDPRNRRRKWSVAAGLLCMAGVAVGATILAVQAEPDICVGMDERLTGVWDDARRSEVELAILGTEIGYAAETWARVEPQLDQYAHDWVVAREDACTATQRGEQSGSALDLRMACLDERLDELRATVDELANADARVVERAVQAVVDLPSLERCTDIEALAARTPPPEDPAVAERVRTADARLVEASVKQRAGRYDEGLALTTTIVDEALATSYEPLQARAWLLQGRLLEDLGDYEAAQAAFERAYVAATAQQMTSEAASAANWLIIVVGYDLARHDLGRRWVLDAEPLSRALGTDVARAEYLDSLGALQNSEGDYEAARASHERALALHERQLGPDHPNVAGYLNALGVVADLQGDYEQAGRYHERALAIRQASLGPEHPLVAGSLDNLGILAHLQGELDEARRLHERALAIRQASLGPDHPALADTLNNLGALEFAAGNSAAAREHYERALEISKRARGDEHPLVANGLDNLGNLAFDEGKLEEARRHHERSLEIRTRTQGSEHPDLGGTHFSLASVLSAQGDLVESRLHYERSLAIWERSLGLDHPQLAFTLTGLGKSLADAGDPGAAIPYLERALVIRTSTAVDPNLLADTQFELARVLWVAPADQGRDRERATELAQQARAAWADPEGGWTGNVATVDRWFADH